MSWFNASQLSSFAKQALSQAQKSIDRVLDIQEDEPSAWAETIPYGEPGISPPVSGGWDTSTWGLKSNTEPQSPPIASPKAITKPVRRTVVDESENFFSAFLSPTDVQTIQKSPVVSKPPAKSQRPEEEVKSTLQESLHTGKSRTTETTESKVKDSSLCVSGETLAADTPSPKTEGKHEESVNKESDMKVPTVHLKVSESVVSVKTATESVSNVSTQSVTAETKDMASEAKEQKHEDRQSNTPSPPVSTFSSGTSTTSDIEVLDHESVISESSASSRQETTDSKSSLHLMQTSFQLLSASACPEYNRLDDFQKLTESCCSSDAFERIDSFSVQSLDSRSVSEINSDDELSGKGYALVPIIVNPSTPKAKVVESVEGKSEEVVNETLIIPTEEAEMEESGRSATPVNCEQPDILVSPIPINEGQTVLDRVAKQCEAAESQPEALSEKEDVCKQTLREKLSKQQLHNSNIIKKLRAKDKENENIITKLNKKVKELEEELQHLKQVLDGKEEVEKQHRENIKKLNSVVGRQEKDLGKLQVDMDELEEKNRSIQAALDSAYKELTDLHKANAAKDSEAQEAALSREMKAKEELSTALEKAQEEARQQQETLAIQVGDLRLALQRAEQAAARKEDYLRHEISELQQRLQEAENRNQELSQSVSSTTRPLLRQIENLQATLGSQTSSWEKLEKNLSDRLGNCFSFYLEIGNLEKTRSIMAEELVKLTNQNDELEEKVKEIPKLRTQLRTLLNSQLEMERMKVEQERKKAIFSQEAIKEKERKPFSVSSTPTISRSSSINGVDMAGLQTSVLSQDESHDHSFGPMSASANGSNLYDAVRMGAGSSIIENLQSQLKLREGEITHLQVLEKLNTVFLSLDF
ncbi:PREDICTED: TATA element modulatory factor [Propithecus coquereli]|uniref:TATA element modulatory factor n=1 Tax=Propithecus coquereli TaxID=379532 RepID=UPI00063EF23E|nr:PREDICTED: TATA element modulatory factor [Propithecus coquereli]